MACRSALWGAIVVALSACYPVQQPRERHAAPPRVEAEELLAVRVEQWDLLDGLRGPSELEQGVATRLAGESGWPLASEADACIAREVAAFFSRYRAMPDEILTLWLAGSCGAAEAPAVLDWLELDERDAQALPTTMARWAPFLATGGEGTLFGVGTHMRGARRVFVLSASRPSTEVFRTGPDADGLVRVQGRVRFETERIGAVIGQGTTGRSGCTCDEEVDAPEYDCWCRMAADDDEAWIELLSGEGGFSGPFGTVLARRPSAPRTYHRPKVRLPQRGDDATALVDGINVLRKHAGLEPLRREEEQSRLAQSLYTAMFKADRNGDGPTKARLMEELHAGRAVQAPVRGSSVQQHIARAGNATDWLAFILIMPTARGFLLDPRAESIAVVTHHDPALGFGAAFAAYSFFNDSDDAAAAQYAYSAIEARRRAAGLTTKRVAPPPELVLAANRVSAGEVAPDQALSAALAAMNAKSKRLFTGTWFNVSSRSELDDVAPSVLTMPWLECRVMVAHRKGPQGLWGEQIALLVFPLVGKGS